MPMNAIFTSHNTVSTETTFCHDQSRKKEKEKASATKPYLRVHVLCISLPFNLNQMLHTITPYTFRSCFNVFLLNYLSCVKEKHNIDVEELNHYYQYQCSKMHDSIFNFELNFNRRFLHNVSDGGTWLWH